MISGEQLSTRKANRLIGQTSPYLLQHAYNPVDWYPWGDEALDEAHRTNRPLLISIGYAACHWCHVMERESFEDPSTARVMNENFVCIKVDREERPDIDAIYMDAVQAITGQGGWPMTIFASAEGIPFFGGTYFPPQDRPGLPSFKRAMHGVISAWHNSNEQILQEGRDLVERIAAFNQPPKGEGDLDGAILDNAVARLSHTFDHRHGGFGGAPKFAQPPVLEFLLRMAAAGKPGAAEMIETTLTAMARGGIYDQLGGGFARYTVDAGWLTPHFEKMLYDNAQLARLYTRAWQHNRQPLYKRIALETLEYLLRDMHDPCGVFYASEDADSEGQEGRFYLWSHDQFMALAPEAAGYYGVREEGNFEGLNILTAASDSPPAGARKRLFDARAARVRPGRDDKALTSWNGLTISALAEAGMTFGRPDLVAEAARTARFILQNVRNPSGRLQHSYKDGQVRVMGLLEDYAYLAEGLLGLWEATFEPEWFRACLDLSQDMLRLFWDDDHGGLFTTGNDHEKLILRQKEITESVTPSPNAVASMVFQKLALLTGRDELTGRAETILSMAHAFMAGAPQAVATFLQSLDLLVSAPVEISIVGERTQAMPLIEQVWGRFLPNKVMAGSPPGIESPLLEGKGQINGRATAYVCRNMACRAPTNDPGTLAGLLG